MPLSGTLFEKYEELDSQIKMCLYKPSKHARRVAHHCLLYPRLTLGPLCWVDLRVSLGYNYTSYIITSG